MESFKELVIRKMKEQNTCATKVAKQIGVSRQCILDILKNDTTTFSRDIKERLAKILNFSQKEYNTYLIVPYDAYHFGMIVKEERQRLGLSQKELKEQSGVSLPIICSIEKRRIVPTKKIRVKLRKVLPIPEEYVEVM